MAPILMIVVLSALLLPGAALADTAQVAKVELSAPAQADVGDKISIEARALDASGTGIPGVVLVFTQAVTFLNTEDSAELGRSLTNAQGKATFTFVPRTEGDESITVRPSGTASRAKGTAIIKVATGPAQHESERTGVHVPGANMWLMAIVLSAVWGMFLWAMAQLRNIFLQGQNKTSSPRLGQRHA